MYRVCVALSTATVTGPFRPDQSEDLTPPRRATGAEPLGPADIDDSRDDPAWRDLADRVVEGVGDEQVAGTVEREAFGIRKLGRVAGPPSPL